MSNDYVHFGATRLVGYLSNPARPRCTQIYVYPREFMTLRVAQFSLKMAHLYFFDGATWTPCLWSPSPIMTSGVDWARHLGKGVLWTSSDEVRSIFLGLKLTISGFWGLRKFWYN